MSGLFLIGMILVLGGVGNMDDNSLNGLWAVAGLGFMGWVLHKESG